MLSDKIKINIIKINIKFIFCENANFCGENDWLFFSSIKTGTVSIDKKTVGRIWAIKNFLKFVLQAIIWPKNGERDDSSPKVDTVVAK
jgi:hypothetical protein